MTPAEPDGARPSGALAQTLVIAASSVIAGAIVIPYGASMPYVREGIPGPGLFPMMIGGLLILFGVMLAVTDLLAHRRISRAHADASTKGNAVSGVPHAQVADPPQTGAAVPDSDQDVPAEDLVTVGVMDTDIGSDGARRWINGAVLMGGILVYVLLAETLGFPLTMAVLVAAIVWTLRARWWVAVATGVLTSLGLWALFELVLMVQLPDGIFPGF